MSSSRQEELSVLLERVLSLPPVAELKPDGRTRRIHYDWLEAGEHTQRTVAQLSQQLRRFLDDQAWLENRRIMDILRALEVKALALRESPPPGEVMHIADMAATIELPMERPLYTVSAKTAIAAIELQLGDAEAHDEWSLKALYSQVVIDKGRLTRHIRQALRDRPQITLGMLCELQPLQHGLLEVVTYLELASESFKTVVDEDVTETIVWQGTTMDGERKMKQARLPRVIFVK